MNKHFTFQNQSKGIGVVLKFTVNIVVCYLLAYGIAKPAVRFLLEGSSLKVQDNLSMLAGMVLFVGFNYIGQDVYKRQKYGFAFCGKKNLIGSDFVQSADNVTNC